ncbi:MAG: hypothetical protein AAGA96_17640 [Verrucomicrobiota bacterium]
MKLFPFLLVFISVFLLAEEWLPAQKIIERGPDGQVILKQVGPNNGGPENKDQESAESEDSSVEAQEPLSAQISGHILKLAEKEREKRMKFMQVVINDVSRLCNLNAAQTEQLQIAAKGASERSMRDWHVQAERYFRNRLDGADSDTAKEMLSGMGNVNFGGNRSEEEGESLDLWKDTLGKVLTPDQIAEYESVIEQRHLDRIEAFSQMSLTTIDSHLRLTPEQKEKMAELIHQAAVEYLDDVQRYWGDYFEKAMLLSLANAHEVETLKEILEEDQFERLKSSTTSFDHFWDSKKREKERQEKAVENREKENAEQKDEEVAPSIKTQ